MLRPCRYGGTAYGAVIRGRRLADLRTIDTLTVAKTNPERTICVGVGSHFGHPIAINPFLDSHGLAERASVKASGSKDAARDQMTPEVQC